MGYNNYFLTGGSGTLGRELTKQLLADDRADKIKIFSRTEDKQQSMAVEFPEYPNNLLRYLLGDICDYDRVKTAMSGSEVVVHAAAMKMIDRCEYNPTEGVRVNVHGSENVFRAAHENKVMSCLFVSTDKACLPISAYGCQKSTAEHLAIGYNNLSRTAFNVVRYGNVLSSAKSFMHTWKALIDKGEPIELCHKDITRFFWSIREAARFLLNTLDNVLIHGDRGCVYVPKMGSQAMGDIASALTDNIKITQFRSPEKLHEDLISVHEAPYTYDCGDYYVIYPSAHEWSRDIKTRGTPVGEGFTLSSKDCL